MANGYTGKILRVNLTTQTITTIDTSKYQQWGGGHGIGTMIFWDLCQDKTIKFNDPGNVVTIMTSPIGGTAAPSGGRTEVQGIAPQPYPIEFFNRSNFGGRFSPMLKMAGWDGIVVEGKANSLCWLKIVNDKVTIEDAKAIKGMDCWDTQTYLWALQAANVADNQWASVGDSFSTQRAAILCTGLAGENQVRVAALIHDAGNGAGESGFGAVWGSKNLKAISVMGSGSIDIADPKALMDARLWLKENTIGIAADTAPVPTFRASGCAGCAIPCRTRSASNTNNESQCVDTYWYAGRSLPFVNPNMPAMEARRATDFIQRYGLDAMEQYMSHQYVRKLYEMGIAGPGKKIDTNPLPMDSYGTLGFAEEWLKAISSRQGIGADLAEGAIRAAEKWGRLEEDLDSGLLQFPQWGYPYHTTMEHTWAFGSLMGERDLNEHSMRSLFPASADIAKSTSAEQVANIAAQKLIPFEGDPLMVNYGHGPDGVYSVHSAKLIAWMKHYSRGWKQNVMYCDQSNYIPSFMPTARGKIGFTPDAEPKFYNAVTGQNVSFKDGMLLGQKLYNIDHAIWILQGRTREMEQFAGFIYKPGAAYGGMGTNKTQMFLCAGHGGTTNYPVFENGQWKYDGLKEVYFTKEGVEQFKDNFYTVEGWEVKTGWPTRKLLESLGLGFVADVLASKNKLA
jgi:aldehyde:ferredoxin oxidoreductase